MGGGCALAIWRNIIGRFLFKACGKAYINVTSVRGREKGASFSARGEAQ